MEIIVYSSKDCGYCLKQKEFLEKKGFKFEIRDISDDEKYFNEFKELGGIGTPLTIKKDSGQVVDKILGFNVEKLLKLLS